MILQIPKPICQADVDNKHMEQLHRMTLLVICRSLSLSGCEGTEREKESEF